MTISRNEKSGCTQKKGGTIRCALFLFPNDHILAKFNIPNVTPLR